MPVTHSILINRRLQSYIQGIMYLIRPNVPKIVIKKSSQASRLEVNVLREGCCKVAGLPYIDRKK